MKDGKNAKANKNKNSRPKNFENKSKVNKTVEKEDNFLDDSESGDKRLIVFIAIAILVIVGTVIALIVGCEKKKDPEPEKPKDDIVVPIKKDDKEDNKGVETKEVVRKVSSVYKSKKSTSKSKSSESSGENEEETYTVTLYVNNSSENQTVAKGSSLGDYVPVGYSACTYYTDENREELYDTSSEVTEDMNVYLLCDAITYKIFYDEDTTNPSTYTVLDDDTTLVPEVDDQFKGWFAEDTFVNQVLVLNKDIISFANAENEIYLYAKYDNSSEPLSVEAVVYEQATFEEEMMDELENVEEVELQEKLELEEELNEEIVLEEDTELEVLEEPTTTLEDLEENKELVEEKIEEVILEEENVEENTPEVEVNEVITEDEEKQEILEENVVEEVKEETEETKEVVLETVGEENPVEEQKEVEKEEPLKDVNKEVVEEKKEVVEEEEKPTQTVKEEKKETTTDEVKIPEEEIKEKPTENKNSNDDKKQKEVTVHHEEIKKPEENEVVITTENNEE